MSKQQQLKLNERAQHVLSELVDIYTETGQPVGSSTLVERSKLDLSGASFRNIMREIEGMGLLTHPHTSAGRIPTAEGFRFYANNLVRVADPSKKWKAEIGSKILQGRQNKESLRELSNTLSSITGCTALISAPKRTEDELERIEFLRLSDGKVLAILVNASGKIENRVIEVPDFVDVAELNQASNDMKKIIAGQTLGEAREQLISYMAEQRGRINEVIDQMMSAAHQWGEPTVTDGALVVAGSNNLFQYPELVRERLQGLIRMFEEKRTIMALMDEVQKGEGVQIFVGKDAPLDLGEDTSLIASSYGDKGTRTLGTLGVIGPLRMNYNQTIGLVDFTSKMLTNAMQSGEGNK